MAVYTELIPEHRQTVARKLAASMRMQEEDAEAIAMLAYNYHDDIASRDYSFLQDNGFGENAVYWARMVEKYVKIAGSIK